MQTTFSKPINNIRTTLASSHTSGATTLALASGTGTLFGSTFPLRVTVVTAASYGSSAEVLTIFSVTARTTDTLTVGAPIEGTTDQTYAIGDIVEMRDTAGAFSDIHTAVNTLETNISAGAAHSVMLGEGTTTPAFATIGTVGRVLTDNGSGADPSFLAIPNATYASAALGSPYTLTTSFASSGLTITLPATGTYLLSGAIRGIIVGTSTATGSATGNAYIVAQLYDVTNSVVVPNSTVFVMFTTWQVITVVVNNQATSGFGPVPYSITGSATIQLRGLYAVGSAVTLTNIQFGADSNGTTVLTGLRIY